MRQRAVPRSSASGCPTGPSRWNDLVRGEVTFPAGEVRDYVLVRANGEPLYTLVNPVDDALMQITHVLRGEDLLSSTPRQLALWAALREIGVATGPIPAVRSPALCHGGGEQEALQARPGVVAALLRRAGLPARGHDQLPGTAGLVAERGPGPLLAAGDGRGLRHLPRQCEPGPIRPEEVHCAQCRLDPSPRRRRVRGQAGLLPPRPTRCRAGSQLANETVRTAAALVQERVETLGQAADMLHFLLVDEASFAVDPEDAAKQLTADSRPVLEAASRRSPALEVWSTEAIEAALRAALIDGLGLKPRVAFGPVRVAISGRRVSPPLFESLEILGKERSLVRLTAALQRVATPDQGRFGRAMPGWVSSGACRNFSAPMGYGVIGSPTVSGSVSLGSSPGTPARWSSCPPGYCLLTFSPARPVSLGQFERGAEYARPRCVAA